LEARPEDRATPQDLNNIYLRSPSGSRLVALSSVTSLQERGAAPELRRIDRLPAVTLDASLAPGYDMGSAIDFFEQQAKELLPSEARLSYKGMAREFSEASSAIYVTFMLALVIVFLVLAAQFESWIHPLIIMLTVPLAIAGAAIAIWLTGDSLNIYSQIGMIMLVGLMAKNGILIVEFANQLRDQGADVLSAVRDGHLDNLWCLTVGLGLRRWRRKPSYYRHCYSRRVNVRDGTYAVYYSNTVSLVGAIHSACRRD
jgi:multidrug efflux pump